MIERSMDSLLDLKALLSELACYSKSSQFYWWRISDASVETDNPFSILVFGREMIADDIVSAFFHNRGFNKVQLGQCAPGKSSDTVDLHRQEEDAMVIMETPSWQQPVDGDTHLLQTLLDTRLDISGKTYNEVLNGSFGKRILRRLRKSIEIGPEIRESRDKEDILRFRRELLVSSARAVHGQQANVPSESELKSMADKLILFYMSDENSLHAGGLAIWSRRNRNLRLWRIGLSDELMKDAHLKSQYHIALFFQMVQCACDMGLSTVSEGLTAPVMTHGNYLYKLRLSCVPVILPRYPICMLRFFTDNLPELLDEHPLFVIRDGSLVGQIGIRKDLPPSAVLEHLNSFCKGHTFTELKYIDCTVHTDWFDEEAEGAVAKLDLYELLGIERKGKYTILALTRRLTG